MMLYLEGGRHDLQDVRGILLQQTNLSNGEIFLKFLRNTENKSFS